MAQWLKQFGPIVVTLVLLGYIAAFARLEIVLAADAEALVVPPGALASFAGVERVFELEVAGDRTVARGRRVEVGRRAAERVEITSGLAPGAVVVLEPGNLVDGAVVRPVGGTGD